MEPKVLADALVEAGIIERDSMRPDMYSLRSTNGHFVGVRYEADNIITDWRVAGKVLESMDASITRSGSGFACAAGGEWVVAESLPRAIIEAWYAATEQEGE